MSKQALVWLLAISLLGLWFQSPARCDPLTYLGATVLDSEGGVKAVVMNQAKTRVYALNLESMSIWEYDRPGRKFLRKLKFKATPAKGYNYKERCEIDSYAEKPVEGCITHNDRYLWVSLHNAKGIVVWDLKGGTTRVKDQPYKQGTITWADGSKQAAYLRFFKTGKTPKVIVASPDGRYLFVSNWHAGTVTVLDIQSADPADWHRIKTIPAGYIPRGMLVSPDSKTLYVAQMGSNKLSLIDIRRLKKTGEKTIASNPRHIVQHGGFMYISFNKLNQVGKIDKKTLRQVKTAETQAGPRTIALSDDGRFLFVTCYHADRLQVFETSEMKLAGTWKSQGKPVAVDLFQQGDQMAAWVGNYVQSNVKIFDFRAP